jgi:hypothetical protein
VDLRIGFVEMASESSALRCVLNAELAGPPSVDGHPLPDIRPLRADLYRFVTPKDRFSSGLSDAQGTHLRLQSPP